LGEKASIDIQCPCGIDIFIMPIKLYTCDDISNVTEKRNKNERKSNNSLGKEILKASISVAAGFNGGYGTIFKSMSHCCINNLIND